MSCHAKNWLKLKNYNGIILKLFGSRIALTDVVVIQSIDRYAVRLIDNFEISHPISQSNQSDEAIETCHCHIFTHICCICNRIRYVFACACVCVPKSICRIHTQVLVRCSAALLYSIQPQFHSANFCCCCLLIHFVMSQIPIDSGKINKLSTK